MTTRSLDQSLSEREEAAADALARQAAALLEPLMAEIDRKLDSISQKMDALVALLAQCDAGTIDALLARPEAPPGAARATADPRWKGTHDYARRQFFREVSDG